MSYTVEIKKDGNAWCALIGENLAEGYVGFGDTIGEALRELANEIGAEGQGDVLEFPPPSVAKHRVNS